MQRPSFSIYDASAGSGKTYTLVKEYLKIILIATKNDAYRNILAITFTNKAVHEMKSRIVENLSEFAKDEPNEKSLNLIKDLSNEIKLSQHQIKIKSQQIIKHIIHNYAAFDISTIDKFTHKVIRAFAHDLGLPMTFEVTLDTKNLLMEAVDAIIAQAGEDETLTKILIDFTMEKTDDDKSWDISNDILETAHMILNENNRNEISCFQDKTISEFFEIKKNLIQVSNLLNQENIALANKALDLIEKKGINKKSFSAQYFPKHLQSIQQGKFNFKNKTYHEFDDIKINKTAKDRETIETIIPELLQILAEVYKTFEKIDFYKAFLKNITPLSLLNTVSNELTKIQEEQNMLSISEFNSLIHKEIQNQPAPFIYERLGERYRHFFIDEFQDTSEMQWLNLIPLIDNATSSEIDGEKGTLMIVGDPKQSIYRWRGGKAEQFIELSKSQNPFNNPEKVIEHLDTNYRSYSEIIDFNNSFFCFLSNEFEDLNYKDLYKNHSFQKSNSKIGGYVNIAFIPNNNLEDEDEDTLDKTDLYLLSTLNTIQKSIQNGFQLQDIAILTRKKKDGIAIANYLTQQGIPLLSSETLMIQNATEVRFIIHTLKYLKNSSDMEAKAQMLYYLASNLQQDLPVHDFILQGMEHKEESEFEDWLSNFNLKLIFQDIRKKSLYETVELLINKTLQSQSNNAYLQYFLDIVLERDIRNQAGVSDFLIYWEQNAEKFSIPSPEGKNAVRIITIHKSKGLEFPVVIMPFADENYTHSPKDKLWISADEIDFGVSKVLIDNTKAVKSFSENAEKIYIQKSQEQLLDNINILYVALTRAAEQLYVISRMDLDAQGLAKKNCMSSFFINYLMDQGNFDPNSFEYEFGNPKKLSSISVQKDSTNWIEPVTKVLNSKNIKIAQREAVMWGTSQQDAIEYGNIVHEILSFIKTKLDIELALTKAIEMGLIRIQQKETIRETILQIVNHVELTPYFDNDGQVLNEQTIIQKNSQTIKPDRIVIHAKNEVYLLDYKTGTHHKKYENQLENYKITIENMGYKVVKKALVYIGEMTTVLNL